VDRVALGVADGDVFMVAAHGVKPGPGQPVEGFLALGAAIDQVADAEEAIARRVETSSVQRSGEAGEVAMDVSYGEVAPVGIAGVALEMGGHGDSSRGWLLFRSLYAVLAVQRRCGLVSSTQVTSLPLPRSS